MTDELVKQSVVRAVQRAYDEWAAEHPSLSAVIDRIALTEQAAQSLRDSPEYRYAVAAYRDALGQSALLDRLTELAGPLVSALLGG